MLKNARMALLGIGILVLGIVFWNMRDTTPPIAQITAPKHVDVIAGYADTLMEGQTVYYPSRDVVNHTIVNNYTPFITQAYVLSRERVAVYNDSVFYPNPTDRSQKLILVTMVDNAKDKQAVMVTIKGQRRPKKYWVTYPPISNVNRTGLRTM